YGRRDPKTRILADENAYRGSEFDLADSYLLRTPISAIEAAAKPLSVILGESGAGKSTFLHFLAWSHAAMLLRILSQSDSAQPPVEADSKDWAPIFEKARWTCDSYK